jgi:hypothetical protein
LCDAYILSVQIAFVLANFSRSQTLFRSPLAPLEKGGTEPKRVEVPLFKGDLGGSTPGFTVKRTHFRSTELECMSFNAQVLSASYGDLLDSYGASGSASVSFQCGA